MAAPPPPPASEASLLLSLPDAVLGIIWQHLRDKASRAALYGTCSTLRASPAINHAIALDGLSLVHDTLRESPITTDWLDQALRNWPKHAGLHAVNLEDPAWEVDEEELGSLAQDVVRLLRHVVGNADGVALARLRTVTKWTLEVGGRGALPKRLLNTNE